MSTNMNQKEREEYLREHGIQIETPEDRKKAKSATTAAESVVHQLSDLRLAAHDAQEGSGDDGKVKELRDAGIEFCLIPQDSTKPIQPLFLPKAFADKSPGDALPSYVQSYFADSRAIDANLLQEQATKHMTSGKFKDMDLSRISTASMSAVAAQGTVETFPVVRPADTNHYQGVYIYLDEMGMLKKLPPNSRAAAIAGACGFQPEPIFYGDVFIGRVQTKPAMSNRPFVAGQDTDRGAEWMRRAVSENLAWQSTANSIAASKNAEQPAVAGTDGNVASEEQFDWTQDEEEVELSVRLDGKPIAKNAVKVKFLPKSITIVYDGKEHLQLKWYGAVDVDGCTWTVDGDKLVITAEKASPATWPRVRI